jgi:hypothetical protein
MHRASKQFWERYDDLPEDVRGRADKAFALLRSNPSHPSLQFKKVGAFWSARIDLACRALAIEDEGDFIWVWIGLHGEYERILKDR